jgi:hypothetical protein
LAPHVFLLQGAVDEDQVVLSGAQVPHGPGQIRRAAQPVVEPGDHEVGIAKGVGDRLVDQQNAVVTGVEAAEGGDVDARLVVVVAQDGRLGHLGGQQLQEPVEGKGRTPAVHGVAREQDELGAEAPHGFQQAQVAGPQVVAQVQVRQVEQPQRRSPAFGLAEGVFGYFQLVQFTVGYVRKCSRKGSGYTGG